MAVRTVQNTLEHPGTSSPLAGRNIKIQLNVPGFTTGGTVEKLPRRVITTDATGHWSVALDVNADIDPAGTYYTVQETSGVIWSFIVPAGSTPISLRDCLVSNPPNPTPIVAGATQAALDAEIVRATAAEALAQGAKNLLGLGCKGDVMTVIDAAINSGSNQLTSAAFSPASANMRVQVVNAGAPYNNRGAWAPATVYAIDDLVTFNGNSYIARQNHTSPAAFTVNTWAFLPFVGQVAKTLEATIQSVIGTTATIDVTAQNSVTGATCTFGTDDTAIGSALGAGCYYAPGKTPLGLTRTFFLGEWFMASNTTVYSDGATFKLPYVMSTDAANFRLLTSNRSSATMLSNIHLYGDYTFDQTELTPAVGSNIRGVHVLNCQDWSVERITGVGIPGDTGNVMVVGSNQVLKTATRGRVDYIRNSLIRGLGSSCVQQSAGIDMWYGTLITDGGVAGRFEMDGHAGDVNIDVVVEMAHNTGAATSLMVNSTVTLKPHTNSMSGVRLGLVTSEGVADALGVGYDAGGSIKNVLIERLQATGGGAGINNNNNTNTIENFVVLSASVDGTGTGTIYRTAKSNPGTAYCLCPGMTLYSARATNCTASGFKDIFQTSIVTGSAVNLVFCEAVGNAFDGVLVDKIENVNIVGGKFTSNGTGGFNGSAGVTFNISASPDTRSNGGGGIIHTGALATFLFGAPPTGTAAGDLSGTYPNPTVAKLNGTLLSGLGTGLLKNTTGTGVPSIAAATDVPVVAAGGAGPLSATDATTTNSRAPSGAAGGGLGGTYPNPTVTVVAPGAAGPLNAADASLVVVDANGHFPVTAMPLSGQAGFARRRTGAIAETIPRWIARTNSVQVLGQLTVASIELVKGQVVTKIVFLAGSTGLGTPTNQWFALWNSALALIGTTNDDGATAWGASSEKSLNMLSPYTVPSDGLYYVSCLVAAASANSLVGYDPSTISTGLAPMTNGRDTTHTGLTNLASCPSTATLAAVAVYPFAWVG